MCFHTPKATSAAHRGGSTYFRPLLSLTALLCLTQLLLYTPQSALCQDPGPPKQVLTPKLLVLRVTDSPVSKDAVNGINAGLNASLWSRNFNVADGIRIEIVTKETTVAAVSDTVDKALTEDPNILALRGPFGDETLIDVLPVLSKHGAVAFSPVTGSTTARVWSPNVYFIRVEPAAELRALLRYAMGHLRVRRLGFMYLQKVSYGEEEYKEAVQIMSGMGYELSGVFTMSGLSDKSPKDPVFEAAWEKFAETRPQAVIVFGVPSALTEEFIMRMLTDRRTAGAYLLGRTDVQELMLRVWRQAVEKGVPFVSGQVITTGTSPLAKETRYAAIKRFQIEMEKYLQDSGQSIYKDPKQFLINDEDGERMVSGWIAGEVLMRAMGIPEWVKDRSTFVKSLFNQRRYLIDDLLIGDYGGECSDVSASQGAMCYCNQGGRTVYMKRFVKDYRAEGLDDGVLRMLQCNASGVKLPPPVNAVTLMMTDSSVAVSGTVELGKAFDAALQFSNIATARSPFTMQTINSTLALAPSVLRKEIQEKHIHGVGGFVTLDLLDVPNVTFIDPLFLQPRLNKFRRHVIHLSPTVEQELLVLAFYLGNTTGATAAAVIRCDEAAAVEDVLRRSLVTFGGSLESAALLAGGDSLAGRLPSSGAVFVVGLADGDAALIAGHLTKHSGVRVFVLFSELSLRYAEFTAAFDGSGSADRLVFATSLPHWADVNTESETVQEYHAAVTDETKWTPLSLRAFATVKVMKTIIKKMAKFSLGFVTDFLYANVVVTAADMVYGSFDDGAQCSQEEIKGRTGCAVNYGATRISVWSMSRALNPNVWELFPPVTASIEYVEPPKGGLTRQQLIGIIVGCVAGGMLLVGLILFLLLRRRSARDNANAPKEPTDPVTLVFTDIESSTALWAACPEIMPDAVATHHRLIRALIAKYRCYEVKTIGDSFMIASRSVFAAVQLVRELQQSFLHHDWGTSAIDDAYHVFEEGKAAEDDEYVPPTARLDAAVYRQYWNGLRVRAAVHTGLADIRHDEVTKGYDYYGSTSNTAARTESVANGGQVLLTRAAYMALSTAEREQVDVTALGPVALRGVPKPVEMDQLDAVPGRTFAALRLGREEGLEDVLEDNMNDFSSSDHVSGCSTMSVASRAIVSVLKAVYAAFPSAQRIKVLRTLCERWSVRVPPRFDSVPEDTYLNELIQRLALKAGRVMERKAQVDGVPNSR